MDYLTSEFSNDLMTFYYARPMLFSNDASMCDLLRFECAEMDGGSQCDAPTEENVMPKLMMPP